MKDELYQNLVLCETDVEGALGRFCNNRALYESCLLCFLEDTTMERLRQAMQQRMWDEAFTCVHALKGLAGNMGFVPMFHASAQLVVLIRQGKITELTCPYQSLKRYYEEVTAVIRKSYEGGEGL